MRIDKNKLLEVRGRIWNRAYQVVYTKSQPTAYGQVVVRLYHEPYDQFYGQIENQIKNQLNETD